MKALTDARRDMQAAIIALQGALNADEPDAIASAMAEAGDGIARGIAAMDGTFRGFRRDVEATARKLAGRVQQ